MIIMARRGENLWGHPHWRKLLEAQTQTMSPDGMVAFSPGHLGGVPFSYQVADEIKAFYPDNLAADYILGHQPFAFAPPDDSNAPGIRRAQDIYPLNFNATAFQDMMANPDNRILAPGPTDPFGAFSGVYDTDWNPEVTREQLALPLDFNDTEYGFLSSYSDRSPDAAWLALQVRSNQYLGAKAVKAKAIVHADVGMFYVSGEGVNWIQMAQFTNETPGRYNSLVLIANKAEPDEVPARGDYLGAVVTPQGAFGTVDQTKSYSYEWSNVFELWDDTISPKWEMETDPVAVAAYKGTQHYKFRTSQANYVYSNWIPVVRRPWNPVKYAFRTAGLVRGAHPYAMVVDDVKKSEDSFLYQWTGVTHIDITRAVLPGQEVNQIFLIRNSDLDGDKPKPAAPMLMVSVLPVTGNLTPRMEAMHDGPTDPDTNRHLPYNRLTVDSRGTEARYRIVMVPMKLGDEIPKITYDADAAQATLHWSNQEDTLKFTIGDDNRTRFTIKRGGDEILRSK